MCHSSNAVSWNWNWRCQTEWFWAVGIWMAKASRSTSLIKQIRKSYETCYECVLTSLAYTQWLSLDARFVSTACRKEKDKRIENYCDENKQLASALHAKLLSSSQAGCVQSQGRPLKQCIVVKHSKTRCIYVFDFALPERILCTSHQWFSSRTKLYMVRPRLALQVGIPVVPVETLYL